MVYPPPEAVEEMQEPGGSNRDIVHDPRTFQQAQISIHCQDDD